MTDKELFYKAAISAYRSTLNVEDSLYFAREVDRGYREHQKGRVSVPGSSIPEFDEILSGCDYFGGELKLNPTGELILKIAGHPLYCFYLGSESISQVKTWYALNAESLFHDIRECVQANTDFIEEKITNN